MRKLILSAICIFTAFTLFGQNSIKVETPGVVEVNETFNVTFIIEGEKSPSDFNWESGENIETLWGPSTGRSRSVQIINGKRTSSTQSTYTYVVKIGKAGKFTLPQATATVKGETIYSSAAAVEVIAASSSASSSSGQSQSSSSSSQNRQPSRQNNGGNISDDDIFLAVSLSKNNVVVGEPVIASIKLYQRVNISGFEGVQFPTFNGFWSQELEAPTNIEFARESYEGEIYNSALLRKFVLIPQKQGAITIEPTELMCLVNVTVRNGGTSIFDSFFDDVRTVRKKVVSRPLTVNVKPLPAGAPASFGGGVGTFKVSAKLSKDTLKTHEAASLLVTVSGRGNVPLLEAPKVSFPPDMETYDTKSSEKVDNGGFSGSKFYEFPFIPRSYGDFEIPAIKYSYYDVNTGKYVTLETEAIAYHVLKGADSDNSGSQVYTGVNRKDVQSLNQDIRFISTKPAKFNKKGEFLMGSVAFWLVTVLLVVLAAVCWLVFRKLAVRRSDVVGAKTRKATKMALKRLHLAQTFLKQNLYTAFYEELHKALLNFISDKLVIPVADLSKENISQSLAENGVEQSFVDSFVELLDACEFARYSPDAGHEAMQSHYNTAVEIISSIDSNMKGKKTPVSASGKAFVIALMIVSGTTLNANAQNAYVDSLWNSANAAYTEGRWADAIENYLDISSLSFESAALYCNTADAYYKNGELGKAILYYERSLKIDPSYSDARYNLALLSEKTQDRIDPVPEFILKTWAKDVCYMLNSDQWTMVFWVFLAITLGLLLLFLLGPTVAARRCGFFIGIVTLIITCASLGNAVWQKNDYNRMDAAIVMRPVISVKSSPSSETATDLFILHEGTKVDVLDEVGQWRNISIADGRQGWIRKDDMEFI